MRLKNIVVVLIVLYGFYVNIIMYFTHIFWLKKFIALLVLIVFALDFIIHFKRYHNKQFFFIPLLFMLIFLLVWHGVGFAVFFYSVIFGWILSQSPTFTLKFINITFLIQLLLVIFEYISGHAIYNFIETGVLTQHAYLYGNDKLFLVTGFRPKGLFVGTLVATSFIIYLAMIYRNNLKMLIAILIMAFFVNGRLALIIAILTLTLKLLKKYDIVLYYQKVRKKFSITIKVILVVFPVLVFLVVVFSLLPAVQVHNFLNAFNIHTDSNSGRIFRYIQAAGAYFNYNWIHKLFGFPDFVIFDKYGRPAAAESGLLTMLLSVGLIGTLYYLFYFYKGWKSDPEPLLNFKDKQIGFKYVVLITFMAYLEYNHIGGNVRGTLFWFIIIDQLQSSKFGELNRIIPVKKWYT